MPQVIRDVADHLGVARRAAAAPIQTAVALQSVGRVLHRLCGWIERSRQREALGNLDDRFLRDIGISRAQAMKEAAKPFWR